MSFTTLWRTHIDTDNVTVIILDGRLQYRTIGVVGVNANKRWDEVVTAGLGSFDAGGFWLFAH